jgi:hypothetical protein
MKRKRYTKRPDEDRDAFDRQRISPEMQAVYLAPHPREEQWPHEDESELGRSESSTILRALFASGEVRPPKELLSLHRLALGIIANQEAEFFLDSTILPNEAVLQVRTKAAGHVGPKLVGAIYSALAMSGLDVTRWRVVPFERNSGKRCFAFFVLANPDGTPPKAEVVVAALRAKSRQAFQAVVPERPDVASPTALGEQALSRDIGGTLGASHWERYAAIREFENDRRVAALRHAINEVTSQIALVRHAAQQAIGSAQESGAISAGLQEQVDQALELAITFERERDVLEAKLRSSESELTLLLNAIADNRRRLEEADEILQEHGSASDASRLDQILPEITFIQSSAVLLSTDECFGEWIRALSLMLEDWAVFLKFITKRGKVVALSGSHKGWWELRINRSSKYMTRLYVSSELTEARRRLLEDGRTWLVRVHRKKDDAEQRRVIARLP